MLAFIRLQGAHRVNKNAYNNQIGGVLLQKRPDGTDEPVRYWPGFSNDSERAYDTSHSECFAVVWAVLLLWFSLERSLVTVQTTCDALEWILTSTGCTGKLVHWRLRVSEFEFDVIQCTGVNPQAAKSLSRLKTTGIDTTPSQGKIPVLYIILSIP